MHVHYVSPQKVSTANVTYSADTFNYLIDNTVSWQENA